MLSKQPTLIEVLDPPRFKSNAARTKVTRTIRQPDMDEFERRAKLAAEQTARRLLPGDRSVRSGCPG